MTQRITVIGAGVIGLATAYALVREGHSVDLIDARDSVASATSFANGGQLSYRYVAPLADAGVPWQALGWLLKGDSPLRLRLRLDPAQWRWLLAFMLACRKSVNRRNGARLLELALHSQAVLARWREEDGLADFAWRRNGKLVAFRSERAFAHGREQVLDPACQHVLTAGELKALEPALAQAPFIGGVFTANEEVADCHRFCERLAERLRASGQCRLLLGKPVTRLLSHHDQVVALQVGQEQLEVQRLVLCAGHLSAGLALPGLKVPVYPLKGYSLTAPIGPGTSRRRSALPTMSARSSMRGSTSSCGWRRWSTSLASMTRWMCAGCRACAAWRGRRCPRRRTTGRRWSGLGCGQQRRPGCR